MVPISFMDIRTCSLCKICDLLPDCRSDNPTLANPARTLPHEANIGLRGDPRVGHPSADEQRTLVWGTQELGFVKVLCCGAMKSILKIILVIVAAISSGAAQVAEGSAKCEALAKLALDHVKVVSATVVAAGAFPAPPLPPGVPQPAANPYAKVPEFCRVVAKSAPSADSDIDIEVWLPTSGWNGRLVGYGNGGFAGDMPSGQLAAAVTNGAAAAGTDTGHHGIPTEASWALGHPEKVIDFGYRANHEVARVAKAAIRSYYTKDAAHSYFVGCSNGGRGALMEAQRYPEDYDGILAGAPANYWTHLLTFAISNAQATTVPPESYIAGPKMAAISAAVNKACDASDGVEDGVLNDPRACKFDPAVLKCEAEESNACLTQPQITALKKMYDGARDSKRKLLFPGYVPGAELGGGGWSLWVTGPAPGRSLLFAFGNGFFANMVYEKADWDYKSVTIDEAVAAADKKLAGTLNATDPNLAPFEKHGGKLIVWHGWNDPAIPALNSVDYYNSVVQRMGQRDADSFLRLYLAPGVQHCAGGPGADSFGQGGPSSRSDGMFVSLEDWVEKGTAPGAVIAGKGNSEIKRPLCPYPQKAEYKGGDAKKAESFACGK